MSPTFYFGKGTNNDVTFAAEAFVRVFQMFQPYVVTRTPKRSNISLTEQKPRTLAVPGSLLLAIYWVFCESIIGKLRRGISRLKCSIYYIPNAYKLGQIDFKSDKIQQITNQAQCDDLQNRNTFIISQND